LHNNKLFLAQHWTQVEVYTPTSPSRFGAGSGFVLKRCWVLWCMPVTAWSVEWIYLSVGLKWSLCCCISCYGNMTPIWRCKRPEYHGVMFVVSSVTVHEYIRRTGN